MRPGQDGGGVVSADDNSGVYPTQETNWRPDLRPGEQGFLSAGARVGHRRTREQSRDRIHGSVGIVGVVLKVAAVPGGAHRQKQHRQSHIYMVQTDRQAPPPGKVQDRHHVHGEGAQAADRARRRSRALQITGYPMQRYHRVCFSTDLAPTPPRFLQYF